MDVTCTCGKVFEARSAKARYCSDRCRKLKGKADAAAVVELALATKTEPGEVESAVIEELTNADRLDTALGRSCLVLARRLDRPGLDTGSALSTVAGRLDELLAKATKGAGKATAPQQLRDELTERRAKRA